MKNTFSQNSMNLGEVSQKALGRYDADKPIWRYGVAKLENFLNAKIGGAFFWPGTEYIASTRNNGLARLEQFRYSNSQAYVLEIGASYMRFFANGGQVVSGGSPVEISTPYALADVFKLQFANKADVAYIVGSTTNGIGYAIRKLKRTSATSFSLDTADLQRGPFLDQNATNVKITPAVVSGVNVNFVASCPAWGANEDYVPDDYVTEGGSTYKCLIPHTSGTFATDLASGDWVLVTEISIFQTGHAGSLWRIKSQKVITTTTWAANTSYSAGDYVYVNGEVYLCIVSHTSTNSFNNDLADGYWTEQTVYVKIATVTNGYTANGNIQYGGELEDSPVATELWSEGAFSNVRGYPTAVTFHEQRLVLGGALFAPSKFYASAVGEYENFEEGASDADAYAYEINADDVVPAIRWLSSNTSLQVGTAGGTFTAQPGGGGVGITPTSISVTPDTDYSVFPTKPNKVSSFLYYIAGNGFDVRQLVYSLELNKQRSADMTMISEHILRDGDGAVQMARQQSPNDRLWIIRADGQIAVFTRDAEQGVMAWSRRIAGSSAKGAGLFKSICILPQDKDDDQIYIVAERNIGGSVKRYVEIFTKEFFTDYFEPVRLDASLNYDEPVTITGVTQASPVVISAPSHGFSNGDQIKIDNVIGMTDLNANIYYAAGVTANTFNLVDKNGVNIDGTNFGAYLSGGEVRKMVTLITGLDHLIGETVSVAADGGLPAGTQTYTVDVSGNITLAFPAAVVHVGLPYTGKIQLLPLGDGSMIGTGQTKLRKVDLSVLRLYKSLGGKIGFVDLQGNVTGLMPIIYPTQTPNIPAGHAPTPFTGDIDTIPDADFTKNASFLIEQDVPLPFYIMSIVLNSEVFER